MHKLQLTCSSSYARNRSEARRASARVPTRCRARQRTEWNEDIRDIKISQEWVERMRHRGSVWRRVESSTPEETHLHNQHRPFFKNAVCLQSLQLCGDQMRGMQHSNARVHHKCLGIYWILLHHPLAADSRKCRRCATSRDVWFQSPKCGRAD